MDANDFSLSREIIGDDVTNNEACYCKTCSDCGGSGEIDCIHCYGSGKYENSRDGKCNYCRGSGRQSCIECGGSGSE